MSPSPNGLLLFEVENWSSLFILFYIKIQELHILYLLLCTNTLIIITLFIISEKVLKFESSTLLLTF